MGVEILLGGTANPLKGDATYQGVRVHQTQRGQSFSVSEVTGTVAAALAANSSVFAMRTNPGATLRAYIQRIRLQFSTIVAFTTPVTAGRRLGVFRGGSRQLAEAQQLRSPRRKARPTRHRSSIRRAAAR